jgi:WD40 repeat protein
VERDRKQRKAANTFGDPVKFPSKLLAVRVSLALDPLGDAVFVAEAAGTVTGIRLSSNQLSKAPSGPKAPVTNIASYNTGTHLTVYASCWDKSIWAYKFERPASGGSYQVTDVDSFNAHADFVKSLTVAYTPDRQVILVSGGADGDLRIWTPDGQPLATLKPQARAIECIVLDPMAPPEAPVIFFSTSQRDIFKVAIPPKAEIGPKSLQLSPLPVAHETSVYRLHFDNDGDLWTASADKTAKRLVRENGWFADITLPHPDFVRDVVTHERYGLVITACRDEEVRVWDRGSGSLRHVFTGHFEEVTGLALSGNLVISVSIDATLRRWDISPPALQKAIDDAKNPDLTLQDAEPKTDLGMLTAEEEAELRALMEDEEAETLEKMVRGEQ